MVLEIYFALAVIEGMHQKRHWLTMGKPIKSENSCVQDVGIDTSLKPAVKPIFAPKQSVGLPRVQNNNMMEFAGFVYPCLLFAYMGESAYLSKYREDLQSSFYRALTVSITATLASVVDSQAIISASFSIISQCRALKCFPCVKIVHTSEDIHGRIYIPEVNRALMLLCLAVLLGFRDTDNIGNAYGLAAISVMSVTTCLMFLIITTVWKRNFIVALIFFFVLGYIVLLYLSACLAKVHKGGWVPVASSLVILCLMLSWKFGTLQKQPYGQNPGLMRVLGIGLIYSRVTSGVPPMCAHFVTNFPAFHEAIIFVTLETVLVPNVSVTVHFFITQVGQLEHHIFRCTVRYGYTALRDSHDFETRIIDKVVELLRHEEREPQVIQVGIAYMIGNTCVVYSQIIFLQEVRD